MIKDGTKANDTCMTIVQTAKKLGVSSYNDVDYYSKVIYNIYKKKRRKSFTVDSHTFTFSELTAINKIIIRNQLMNKSALAMLIFIIFVSLSLVSSAAQIPCGSTIINDTTLDSDMFCSGNALDLFAPGITLDCNGHTISGNDTGTAIYFEYHGNITVKNCIITNFTYGIGMSTDNNFIYNNTITVERSGIEISKLNVVQNGNIIEGNTLSVGTDAIRLWCATNTTIKDNVVTSGNTGIYLHQSNENTLTGNQLDGMNNYGINLFNSSNNIIQKNTLINNGYYGLLIYPDSINNNISYNNIHSNAQHDLMNFLTLPATAENNWWGITNCSLIDEHINDNEEGKGEVDFDPILDGPFPGGTSLACGTIPEYTPISGCTIIDAAGTYRLINSIQESTDQNCIIIESSNVILDGAQFTIDGTGQYLSKGVFVRAGLNNIIIMNLTLQDWYYGIHADGLSLGMVDNCIAHRNYHGFVLTNCDQINLTSNIALNNSQYGYFLDRTNNNVLLDNLAIQNGDSGFALLHSSTYNVLEHNTANGSVYFGFYIVSSSDFNTLRDNTAAINGMIGFRLSDSGNCVLSENEAINNELDGFSIAESNQNTLSDNTAHGSNCGISIVSGSNSSTLHSNRVTNSNYGIFIRSSFNNTIYNNYFDNVENAYDDSSNTWNLAIKDCTQPSITGGTCMGGNFWNDYVGIDNDGDSIGDTELPYTSSGSIQNGGDFMPLMNNQLELNPIGDRQVIENEELIIQLSAHDPEENSSTHGLNPLTFGTNAGVVLPSTFSFDPSSGLFTWTPGIGNTGEFSVLFNVTDGQFVDEETIIITVRAINSTHISGCTIIDAAGTYRLINNIQESTDQNCIIIESSNVILDGAQFTIDGTGQFLSKGVFVRAGLNNIIIKNLTLQDWYYGIHADGLSLGMVDNCIANRNYHGFEFSNCDQINLTSNIALNNSIGYFLDRTNNNVLLNNQAIQNGHSGFALLHSSMYNMLEHNTANGNVFGFYIESSSHFNTLRDNTAINGMNGFRLYDSGNCVLSENEAINNEFHGFSITKSNQNTLSYNTADGSIGGISIYSGSNSSTLHSNRITNMNSGIFIMSSFNNTIYNNYFDNVENAYDDSSNTWNLTMKDCTQPSITGGTCMGGNFWNDYVGIDNDKDSIGDTELPYTSSGRIQNGGDFMPLMKNPPELNPIGDRQVIENEELTIQLSAHDPEGNPLTFGTNAGVVLPGTFSFAPSSGLFTWTPGIGNTGEFSVLFNVTDGQFVDEETIIITVRAINFTHISGCTIIDTAGTYRLINSIQESTDQNCIIIESSNVILDGAQFTIDGTGQFLSKGVFVRAGLNNITIMNLTLQDWFYGIHADGLSLGMVDNCIAHRNYHGFVLTNCDQINLTSNIALNNSQYGYFLDRTNNNVLLDNLAIQNGFGFRLLHSSTYNVLERNTANGNVNDGFYIESSFNTLRNNTAINGGSGFQLSDSGNCVLSENEAINNKFDGFSIAESNQNTLSYNTADGSNFGIFIRSSNSSTLHSNRVTNSNYGIYIMSSFNNMIYNNYFDNVENAYDDSSNTWNLAMKDCTQPSITGKTCMGGNFWSDYVGIDNDGDSIGNTELPYTSSGSIQNGGDFMPLLTGAGNPPKFNPIGDRQVIENEELTIQLSAYDPEGNPLTFGTNAGVVLPSTFSFDPSSGLFMWTPGIGNTGEFSVLFNVTDGLFVDEETITIAVNPMAPFIISSCNDDPDQPGTWLVDQDLVSSGDCLKITSEDVILDCQNHSITGDGTGMGIGLYRKGTIRSCVVNNFNSGIKNAYGWENEINQNIVNNTYNGIDLSSSNNNTVEGNTATNSTYGISVFFSSNNIITGNLVENNMYGIRIAYSNGNLIYDNIFETNTKRNAYEYNSTNVWNISKTPGVNILGGSYLAGNFWDDYNGYDTDNDGIGDLFLPYMGDFLPIVHSCGIFLTSNTTLKGNLIVECPSQGLVMGKDGITLDCQGYTIRGTGTGIGVQATRRNNLYINDCIIDNFEKGLDFYRINSSKVSFVTAQNNNEGFSLFESHKNYFRECDAKNNVENGFSIKKGSENVFKFNSADKNNDIGYYFSNSLDNYIDTNSASNSFFGVMIEFSSNNNTLINMNSHSNYCGIMISRSQDNEILRGHVSFSGIYGIYLHDSSFISLLSNNVTNGKGDGIYIEGPSRDNLLYNNTVANNSGHGIHLYDWGVISNDLTRNTAMNNGGNGIFLDEHANFNLIRDSLLCSNGDKDIREVGSASSNEGTRNICDNYYSHVGCTDSCPSCSNGVRDSGVISARLGLLDETGIDCGGDCPIWNCCANGYWDRNLNEVGVDCEGPCSRDCPTCIPLVQKGSPSGKLDVVFIPDSDYNKNWNDFLDDVEDRIDVLATTRPMGVETAAGELFDRMNFYYLPFDGDASDGCGGSTPSQFDDPSCDLADAVAILHTSTFGDCTDGTQFTAEGFGNTFIHEAGHAMFGLIDEYCGDTWYEEGPNVWESEWDCRVESLNSENCQKFCSECRPSKQIPFLNCEWYKADPSPDEIMCNNLGEYGDDCRNRGIKNVMHGYVDPPENQIKAVKVYLNIKNNKVTELDKRIDYGFPQDHPSLWSHLNVTVLSANGTTLETYSIIDPRIQFPENGSPFTWFEDDKNFTLILKYHEGLRTIELDNWTGESLVKIDLGEEIIDFCAEVNYEDPECQASDLDDDGVLDNLDNCPLDKNVNQTDFDMDGVGDVCDDDEGPITSDVLANPNPVSVNTEITLTATVDDSLTGGATINSAEYNINGGSYISMSALDGDFDSMSENVVVIIPAFEESGVYSICVHGNDRFENNIGTEECILLAVYDPTGGFVTGGGWINSPEGAYTPDSSLTGKANFGFISKYKIDTDVLIGTTEFQFTVADLNFHSDIYEWLVVAGPKAMYKGTGTINGVGNYGFVLSAIDEALTPSTDVDLFRIKIWDKENDTIIYDNRIGEADDADPTTGIGGGSIVIHKE